MSRFIADAKVSGGQALVNGLVLGALVALLVAFFFSALGMPTSFVYPVGLGAFLAIGFIASLIQIPYLARD